MHQTINKSQFRDAFKAMGRGDQFSYDALGMLFDHLDDGQGLDVIAICCAFSEDMPRHIADQYDIDTRGMDDAQVLEAVQDYLNANSYVVGVTDAGAVVYNSEF